MPNIDLPDPVKDEVKHYGQKLRHYCRVWFSAILQATSILIGEWIIHWVFHGIEGIERLNHSNPKSPAWTFPAWMYNTVDGAGAVAFLLYLARMMIVHANETAAETVKELRAPWKNDDDESHN